MRFGLMVVQEQTMPQHLNGFVFFAQLCQCNSFDVERDGVGGGCVLNGNVGTIDGVFWVVLGDVGDRFVGPQFTNVGPQVGGGVENV